MSSAAHHPGCFNRADYVAEIQQQDGWTEDGRRNMVPTPHRMANGCVYHTDPLVGSKDPACIGCDRKQEIKTTAQELAS